MNERANRRRSGVFPRFHTSSPNIWRLFDTDDELRQLFNYSISGAEGNRSGGNILRDSYTYIVRAMFPALAPARKGFSGDRSRAIARRAERARGCAREALDTSEEELARLVETREMGDGRSVSDLIGALESSAMGTIWLRYSDDRGQGVKVPSTLRNIAAGLAAIHRLESLAATRDLAYGFLEDAEELLRVSFGDLALQVQIAERLNKSWPIVDRAQDLSLRVDFAAVRWGIDVKGADDEVTSLRERFLFSDLDELRKMPDRAERAMAILLALNEHSLASRLCDALAGGGDLSPSMLIMDKAAKVFASAEIQSLPQLVAEVNTQYLDLDLDQRQRLALGYGYVLFHSWRRMGFATGQQWGELVPALVLERWPSDPLGWAQRSYDLVELAGSTDQEPFHVFWLNHLVYVAAVAGLRVDSDNEHVALAYRPG